MSGIQKWNGKSPLLIARPDTTSPIATVSGGLFEHYPDVLCRHIQAYSKVELMTSELPPIYGACKKACAVASCRPSDRFYENFKKTYGESKK